MNPVDIITHALRVDRRMAKFILGGLTLLGAAALVISWDYDLDKIFRVAIFILVFCVAIAILANIRGLISLIAAWVILGVGVIYIGLGAAQFLTLSSLTPPVPPFLCFISPVDARCTQLAQSAAIETATVVGQAVDAPAVTAPGQPAATTTTTNGATEQPVPPPPPPLPARNAKVYVQFAGALDRGAMKTFSNGLAALGWTVPGASRGGERIASAAGLNEVRFFHASDKPAAERLARDATDASPAGKTVKPRDLSDGYINSPAGQIELWISR